MRPGCSIIRASLTVARMVSLPRSGSLCHLRWQVPTGHTLSFAPSDARNAHEKCCGIRLWGSAPNPGRGMIPLHPALCRQPESPGVRGLQCVLPKYVFPAPAAQPGQCVRLPNPPHMSAGCPPQTKDLGKASEIRNTVQRTAALQTFQEGFLTVCAALHLQDCVCNKLFRCVLLA